MKTANKTLKWLFLIAGGLGVVVVIVVAAISYKQQHDDNKHQPAAVTAAPTSTPTPAGTSPKPQPPPPPTENRRSPKEDRNSRQSAVDAAVTTTDALTLAQFLPLEQMRKSLKQNAVREVRSKLEAAYTSTGPDLTLKLGWASPLDVPNDGEYKTTVKRIRVGRFGDGIAIISLYQKTHWRLRTVNLSQGTETRTPYHMYGITVVTMKWQSGHWLYVGNHNPTTTSLKGYVNYVYKNVYKNEHGA